MTTGSRRFSIEQAGRALGVSTATVWRMIRRGELPTVRDRGRHLVLAEGLASRARRHTLQDVPPLTGARPIYWLVGAGRGGGRAPGARDKHALLDE
jgi:excisionase family DNA binding protein